MIGRILSRLFGSRSGNAAQSAAQKQALAKRAEWSATALANFPFEIVETTGANALAQWEELKTAGRGVPVVVGHDLGNLLLPFHPNRGMPRRPASESIAAADAMKFPDGLFALRRNENEMAKQSMRKHGLTLDLEEEEAPLGEWPTKVSPSLGLSVARDIRTGVPLPKVSIVLVPTNDPTTIPAHLCWGGWNACPSAAYHVAALRDWRDRYGAELVGLTFDTMEIRVKRKPATREEAMELARVLYAYCNDLIDQGVGSYRALAGSLMEEDWWFFWWD
jgi:hypothetical protein